jgi:hypothetical protein
MAASANSMMANLARLGLRREAERHAAFAWGSLGQTITFISPESAVAAALCQRSP